MVDISTTTPAAVTDADRLAHIQSLVKRNLPRSPVYNFLLNDVSVIAASRGLVRARLPLRADVHINSGGSLHGSVSATIVDWAGGMAIATWDLREKTGVSVDIHVTYLRSAKDGDTIEIEGRADKVGDSMAFTSITIYKVVDDAAGSVVAKGTHTKYVKQREKGT